MGITTIYKCDKCGHEQDTGAQMWRVEIFVSHYNDSQQTNAHKNLSKLWCRACVEDVGLLPYATRPKPAEVVEVPTLEEMIRNVVQDEIAASKGDV